MIGIEAGVLVLVTEWIKTFLDEAARTGKKHVTVGGIVTVKKLSIKIKQNTGRRI